MMPQNIEKEKIILVEGKDEVNFFKRLLEKLDIDAQLFDIGGTGNFAKKLKALQNLDGFENIKAIIIIRDADEDFSAAFISIKNILQKLNLPSPEKAGQVIEKNGIKTGIYIMPDCKSSGMLEDLCIESIRESDSVLFDCVCKFIDCVNCSVDEKNKPKNLSKAKIQTFLAGKKDIVSSLGLGAQKDYWDYEHACMKELVSLLNQI